MWRWSLHKKVERDPGKSPALVRILLRELEKAELEDTRRVIIPLLHTLMYVLTKATGISQELYRRTYALCMRLLTLPAPYCTVALDCAIRLKTETAAPGTLYQRLVIAEQNLRSELYPYQERVFLFVDPELVPPSVCSALLLEIQAAQTQQTPEACMRHVVSHALQAALGGACRADALQRKLQVEQMASEPSATREEHLERLEEIYCSLLGPTAAARGRCGGDPLPERPPSIPLPSPHITFQLWTDEEQLWKELVLFLRPRSQRLLSADMEALDLQGLLPDRELARVSVLKRETQTFCLSPRLSLQLYYIPVLTPEKRASSRHLELGELAAFLGRADPWYESTVNTLCPAIQKLAEMPPSLDTSQTVDPFILDVITYYVRMGTQPIYFQLYTVKIFFGDLSQDSVEDIFLTELKVKVQDSKLPKDAFSPRRRGAAEAPGAELSLCYRKALLSHRTREVTVSLRATGLVLKALPASDTEDHTCLSVNVTEVVKSSNLAGRSFSTVTNTFRAANVQIQSQDQRLLTLWLDKDHRRTFRDVVRFEVAPCPEPCSGVQKSKALWLSSHQQKEVEGTKAKPKPLLMPINTFSGIVQ
ncbi:Phosphoinositide 3-kinase regulatory subunit 6 [Myotis brandtii]|uniref:Phosphoinositide 3-kinase regulatory subunit 6 n=1 Tax=Myotis brandtii TaxID=109478 RepID=S7Q3M4_MYOBR|nr:Phosphoinositide 3-kinase regulatory subunit 6 [Myotis brandtii]